MNFRDRIKVGGQEENAWKENGIHKTASTKNLYREITNQLSQQFEPGDLRKKEQMPMIKKNSRIQETEYKEDALQPQTQNYVDRNPVKSRHQPVSLLSSNADNESVFESKLSETREELEDQILNVEKKLSKELEKNKVFSEDFIAWNVKKNFNVMKEENRAEYEKMFSQIVNQLNASLTIHSKKNKVIEANALENQEKLNKLQAQFDNYTVEMEEKMERLLNTNSNGDAASSIRKSMSRNMGDYVVELKSSIKEIPSSGMVDEIRNEIYETSEAIKSIRFEMAQMKEEIKVKTLNQPTNIEKIEVTENPKLDFINEEIHSLKAQVQEFETQKDSKFSEFRGILEVQDQNIIGMNETLEKVINFQILPRLKKMEDLQQPKVLERQGEEIKRQVMKELESVPIIRVRHNPEHKEKLERMRNLPKCQQDTYMLDENNEILDVFGNYLVDESNKKIRLEEEQIYYLQNIEGIQISTVVSH